MDIIRASRNVTLIALLLSLLFHGSTIIYVLMQKTSSFLHQDREEQLNHPEQHPELNSRDPWVATKARAGNFGAPVFFKDEPEQYTIPQQQEQEQSHGEQQSAAQDSFTTDEEFSDIQETVQQEESQEQATSAIQQQESHTQKETILQQHTYSQPIDTVKKNIPKKKTVRTKKRSNSRGQPFAGPKPPITLAQLTQGFLNHVQEGGNYGVSILSDKRGLPSEQQLKYERYLQRLGWCLQNSYNINSNKRPPMPHDMTTHVFLALNRDGTIQNLNIVKSSGNIHIDQFTLFIFRDASSSFPPVPNYLPDDPFALTYVISIGDIQSRSAGFYSR